MVIHFEQALYQMYAPVPLPLPLQLSLFLLFSLRGYRFFWYRLCDRCKSFVLCNVSRSNDGKSISIMSNNIYWNIAATRLD